MKKIFYILPAAIVLAPGLAWAQSVTLGSLISQIRYTILNPLIGVLLTAALVMFFWGVVLYLRSLGSEKNKVDGKNLMIWGVISLFVMVSVWGLVNLLVSTIGLDNRPVQTIQLPS